MQTYIKKATLMAPCTTFGPELTWWSKPLDVPGYMYDEMSKAGVYAHNGPNWDTEAIKKNSADDVYTFATTWSIYYPAVPVSFKLEDHMRQIVAANRF